MLDKKEIIESLKSKNDLLSEAVYEYVTRFGLYDDKEICKNYIEYIKINYLYIDIGLLQFANINKEIIECLIEVYLKEKKENILDVLSGIFVRHYNIIKDMDYDFSTMMTGEENNLLYKKIQHFINKKPERLIELLKNSVEIGITEGMDYKEAIVKIAVGVALFQTDDGIKEFEKYVKELKEKYKNNKEMYYEYMIEFLFLMFDYNGNVLVADILETFMYNDILNGLMHTSYYLSRKCSDEVVNKYIKCLKNINKEDLQFYHHNIAAYLNSNAIDDFLFNELNRTKEEYIRVDIMEVLAKRFNKAVIPYALKYLEKEKNFELQSALYPLLVICDFNDNISKRIKDEVVNDIFEDEEGKDDLDDMRIDMLLNMQNFFLKDKKHIKKYKKIRKMHNEVVETMMKGYFENYKKTGCTMLEEIAPEIDEIDLRTELGMQTIANIVVYKNSDKINCITEEFLEKNRYKKREKIEMLYSMLNSEAGLFEFVKRDEEEGQVYLKDVLNHKEYCVTDIGLSITENTDKLYMYARLITYDGITFSIGLNILFAKDDKFICNWIKENSKLYYKKLEIDRFIEIYNEYKRNDKGIKMKTRPV